MPKEETTTIQLKKSVVKALKDIRKYPRETYNETVMNLIRDARDIGEFGSFVQKAQEIKMKELCGEGDYSGWEHA